MPEPFFDQLLQRLKGKKSTRDAQLDGLHLEPGLEQLFFMTRNILERDRIDVPQWIADAVEQTMDFAVQNGACALPGHEADLSHGHLLVETSAQDKSLTAQMEVAQGMLFHTQECIDAKWYDLNPAKRNILFDRSSGVVRILDIKDYPNVTEAFAIDPDTVLPGLIAGETIDFKLSSEGLIFASWGRERQ